MSANNMTSEQFYQATSDWVYEMYQSQRLWLRRALFVIVCLLVLLGLSLSSTLLLVPLKEKVPYLYAVDHSSGEITKVGTLEKTTLTANWELSRYLLIHYVIQRENFDADNIDVPYQLVWAQSADNVRQQYEDGVRSANKQSPFQVYGKDKYVTVKVVSVNRLNDSTVDVKFEKHIQDRAANVDQVVPREAIIKWTFDEAETSQKMLDRDPLGFKVTYYQSTQVNLDNNQ